MGVTIVADHGTHLPIRRDDRFAVIERRNNRLYNCHDGKREGIPQDSISKVGTILDHDDWLDEARARTAFEAIVARATQLGQTMR
jgi:hypothetical protein